MPCVGCEKDCKCTSDKCSEDCKCVTPGKCCCNPSKKEQTSSGECCKEKGACEGNGPRNCCKSGKN
uniref:CG8721-like protein n=1 Tax=Drosophila buzzatii TaxID=7264 RepID=I3RSF5_DROBU|nr:CG8721-like protein [Drosophila buzzatii]